MHAYAINGSRAKTGGYIMVLSVVVASLVNELVTDIWTFISYDIYPLSVSIPFMFGALFYLYNKWLWRWPAFSRIAGVPNIKGEWVGPLYSSHNVDAKENDRGSDEVTKGTLRPVFTIHQTWARIEINSDFSKSRSESTTASFRTEKGNSQLVFTYMNFPRDHTASHGPHEGVNKLRLVTDGDGNDVLEGEYYTDESRNNHGTLELRRPDDAERANA